MCKHTDNTATETCKWILEGSRQDSDRTVYVQQLMLGHRESLNYPIVVKSLTSKNPRHHLLGLNSALTLSPQGTARLCSGHSFGLPCVARNDLDWGLLLKREVPAAPHPGEHYESSFLRSGCLQWKPLMSRGLGSHLKRFHFFSGSSILIPHPASSLWLWASFMSWFSLQLKWASPSHWGPPEVTVMLANPRAYSPRQVQTSQMYPLNLVKVCLAVLVWCGDSWEIEM